MAAKKEDSVNARVSPKLKLQIQKRAEVLGKSISEYITDLIKADLKESSK